MACNGLSRKAFVQGSAAASLALPAFIAHRGDAAQTLRIGEVWELTGVFADVAQNGVRGAAIAVDWWNQRGGVLGRRVEALVEDN
ncbi:ABC transporter substrate-binding protein, partial [bacterium]